MSYQDSLVNRIRVISQTTVAEIADAHVLAIVVTLPVFVGAYSIEAIDFALVAVTGWAVWTGGKVARDRFDHDRNRTVFGENTEVDSGRPQTLAIFIGAIYLNTIIALAMVLGTTVANSGPLVVGVAVATIYAPFDTAWGIRDDRLSPVWTVVSAVVSILGYGDILPQVADIFRGSFGPVSMLTQIRYRF